MDKYKDKMTFKRRVYKSGGSIMVNIPIEIANYLNLFEGDSIEMLTDIGAKGKYCAFWKSEEE